MGRTLPVGAASRRYRRIREASRALDFGCGTGRLVTTLAAYVPHVFAVDREPAMVEAARRNAGRVAECVMCTQDERTPFPAGFFDLVLCSSVLCVTTRELFARSLQEIARVAKPGATLLLLEQVAASRGLGLKRYLAALHESGFEAVRAYPIRGRTSLFTSLAGRCRWIPAVSYPALAALEIAMTARSSTARAADSYVEYTIVGKRV